MACVQIQKRKLQILEFLNLCTGWGSLAFDLAFLRGRDLTARQGGQSADAQNVHSNTAHLSQYGNFPLWCAHD